MKCNDALILIDSVFDGEASPEEEQLLRFHVNGCQACRKIMLANKSIRKQLSEIEEPDVPSDLMSRVHQRLASGNYDRSPLKEKSRFKLPIWRIAAVIPFAAALVFILQSAGSENSANYRNRTTETTRVEETDVQYAPVPVIAYSRPSSVSTF